MSIQLMKLPTSVQTAFVCRLCGQRVPVEFRDPAPIDELEPVPGKDRWAREQAISEANGRLLKQAAKALPLVVCPRCGQRDPLAHRRALRRAILPFLAVAPWLFMAGVIATSLLFPSLARANPLGPVLVGCSLLVVAAPPILIFRRRQLVAEADRSVRFLPEPSASRPTSS